MVEMRGFEHDGLVHHWAQGPLDVEPLDPERTQWEFCWYLETPDAVPNVSAGILSDAIDFLLNRLPQGWHRSGVHFRQVDHIAEAHIVLRFTDASPPDWPDLPWSPGWYYHDSRINKNVAQVTPRREYFDHTTSLAYIVGMELAGHGCFRMWDMYISEHEPYPLGSMGGWAAALANNGFPTDLEIECAKAWLEGAAVQIHSHGFTVPEGEHHHGT